MSSDRKAMLLTEPNRPFITKFVATTIFDRLVNSPEGDFYFVYGNDVACELLHEDQFEAKYRWTSLQDNYNGVEYR